MSTTINGTHDITQRQTLRIEAFDTAYEARVAYDEWADKPITPKAEFTEDDAMQGICDMSTVEELADVIKRNRYLKVLCATRPKLAPAVIMAKMQAYGEQLRAHFIEQYGYPPEQSTTPTIAVTIDGPMDMDTYVQRNAASLARVMRRGKQIYG